MARISRTVSVHIQPVTGYIPLLQAQFVRCEGLEPPTR